MIHSQNNPIYYYSSLSGSNTPSEVVPHSMRKKKKSQRESLQSSQESLPFLVDEPRLPNHVFISVDPGVRNCYAVVMEGIPVTNQPGKYKLHRIEVLQRFKFLDFPNVVESLKQTYGQGLDGFLAQESERDIKLLFERDSFILVENIKTGNALFGLVIEKQGEDPYSALQHHILHACVVYSNNHSLTLFTRVVSPIAVSIYYQLSKLSGYNRDKKKELTIQAVNKVLWDADFNAHCADCVLNLFYIEELREYLGKLLRDAILGDRHDDVTLPARGRRKPQGNIRATAKKSRNTRATPGSGPFL